MELYRVSLPDEEKIIVRDRFIIDTIIPLCIKKLTNDQYSILFFAEQESTESSIFLQSIIALTNETDEGFLNNHPLNVDNIRRDPKRLEFYNEKIDSRTGNVFNTDFDMEEYEKDKHYFYSKGSKPMYIKSSKEPKASVMDLLITRDNFIRISLFFTKFLVKDITAETIFITHKLRNVAFETITHVKLDASCTDTGYGMVHNHYTMGHGPSIYRMNFISPVYPKRKLREPMIVDHYKTFYENDFLIRDIIFDNHQDRIFIIFEVRSDITNQYKETKALILDKAVYDKTNFVKLDNIYEEGEVK